MHRVVVVSVTNEPVSIGRPHGSHQCGGCPTHVNGRYICHNHIPNTNAACARHWKGAVQYALRYQFNNAEVSTVITKDWWGDVPLDICHGWGCVCHASATSAHETWQQQKVRNSKNVHFFGLKSGCWRNSALIALFFTLLQGAQAPLKGVHYYGIQLPQRSSRSSRSSPSRSSR